MELLRGEVLPPSSLVLAAHPDDEVVGAAVLIARSAQCGVVYVTDGAPRDPRFWARSFRGNRVEYARLRRSEAEEALALAGVRRSHIHSLSGIDQDAAREISTLARELAALLERLRPAALVLQAYEGGHPDHDAASAIGRAAALLLRRAHERAPTLIEMTGYHARNGGLVVGEFLDAGDDVVRIEPAAAEVALKQRMIDAHRSQSETLAPFQVGPELFRAAPRADYSRPPHAGELYSERMGWMPGEEFRSLACAALGELGLPHTLG
jgi:LmbE family N-acetylglucosaminyl deacetylase